MTGSVVLATAYRSTLIEAAESWGRLYVVGQIKFTITLYNRTYVM